FLSDPSKNDALFFHPVESAGPDLVFFICNGDDKLVPVFVQLKLSRDVNRKAALSTIQPNLFYTDKNGKILEKYQQEFADCMKSLEFYGRCIGLVICYPKTFRNEVAGIVEIGGLKCYKRVIDKTNVNDIFGERHLNLLAQIDD
ncbi:hypothetical protein HK099_000148, partial [Clydaea vesicula]